MSKNSMVAAGIILIAVVAASYLLLTQNKSKNTEENLNQVINNSNNGLKIEDIKVGTGSAVKAGDTVVINYTGTLEDGTKFDSSYDHGQPFTTQIGVGQVIKGWDEGVVGMKVGGERKLTIPPDLAYGDQSVGSIPPNSTLIFDVSLVAIKWYGKKWFWYQPAARGASQY